MSKKVISLLLAVMLTAAMIVVAAISVSADTDDEGSYVPSEGTETYHIYFCKPDEVKIFFYSDFLWRLIRNIYICISQQQLIKFSSLSS